MGNKESADDKEFEERMRSGLGVGERPITTEQWMRYRTTQHYHDKIKYYNETGRHLDARESYNDRKELFVCAVERYLIFVTLLGKTITLDVKNTDTIESVKRKIQDTGHILHIHIPLNQQRLTFARKQLENGFTLKYYDVGDGDTLYLALQQSQQVVEIEKEKEIKKEGTVEIENEINEVESPFEIESPNETEKGSEVLCVVCMARNVETCFIPCGHACCCRVCSGEIQDAQCHICRAKIDKIQTIYLP